MEAGEAVDVADLLARIDHWLEEVGALPNLTTRGRELHYLLEACRVALGQQQAQIEQLQRRNRPLFPEARVRAGGEP